MIDFSDTVLTFTVFRLLVNLLAPQVVNRILNVSSSVNLLVKAAVCNKLKL